MEALQSRCRLVLIESFAPIGVRTIKPLLPSLFAKPLLEPEDREALIGVALFAVQPQQQQVRHDGKRKARSTRSFSLVTCICREMQAGFEFFESYSGLDEVKPPKSGKGRLKLVPCATFVLGETMNPEGKRYAPTPEPHAQMASTFPAAPRFRPGVASNCQRATPTLHRGGKSSLHTADIAHSHVRTRPAGADEFVSDAPAHHVLPTSDHTADISSADQLHHSKPRQQKLAPHPPASLSSASQVAHPRPLQFQMVLHMDA
jgi:hypothetical protein